MRLIVWGAGELGGRVGALWVRHGGRAIGFTESLRRHAALRQAGIEPCLGSAAPRLRPDDALLLALPGSARQHAAIEALPPTIPAARAVLLSSTGYYGTPHGCVDEDTPHGDSEHALSVAAAEHAFRDRAGAHGVIVRLGGLYCHGRGPGAALQRRGMAPPGPADRPLALMHYDDAATAILAALRHPQPEAVYVAVTPPCPTRGEFYRQACERIGLPEPVFEAPRGLPPAVYDITRLRRDLVHVPAYPDWREALPQHH